MNGLNLKFSCGIQNGDYIYASCRNFNGLYKISVSTKVVEFQEFFCGEGINMEELHRGVIRYKDQIYFYGSAKCIHVYNLMSQKMHTIEFRTSKNDGGVIGHLVGNCLWLFPEVKNRSYYKIDLLTENVTVFDWETIPSCFSEEYEGNLFSIRTTVFKEQIILPVFQTNIILVYDVKTESFAKYELPLKNLLGCFRGERNLWLLADDGNSVYSWDCTRGNNKATLITSTGKGDGIRRWNWLVEVQDCAYLLPAYGENISVLNGSQITTALYIDRKKNGIEKAEQLCYEPVIVGTQLWVLPCAYSKIIILENGDVKSTDELILKIPDDVQKQYLQCVYCEVAREGKRIYFPQFVQGVSKRNGNLSTSQNCCDRIWEKLR